MQLSLKCQILSTLFLCSGKLLTKRTDNQKVGITNFGWSQSFTPIGLDLKNPLKRTCAKITLPTSNSDKPVKFSSNLPLKIHIEAQLEFVDYINSIAIMVCSPRNLKIGAKKKDTNSSPAGDITRQVHSTVLALPS
jgi:hypothetical protein